MAAVNEPAKFGDSLYGLMHENAKLGKQYFEPHTAGLERVSILKRFLRSYIHMNPLKFGKKYGLVCHCLVIYPLTANGYDAKAGKLIGGVFPKNTQLVPLMNLYD